MAAQANEANTATDETPAKAAPLCALRLAFCTRLRQAPLGIADPARLAASVMGVRAKYRRSCELTVFASCNLLVYTRLQHLQRGALWIEKRSQPKVY
jgi:hypothetical protein